nr:TPM domain-containing protein [Planctomycetota bacterium]
MLASLLRTGLLLATMMLASLFAAVTVAPDASSPIVDQARVLEASQRERMTALIAQLRSRHLAQLGVITVASTQGEDFFAFVQRHAELWKLGESGKDNGVLVVVAVQDHEVRIQTGYGME